MQPTQRPSRPDQATYTRRRLLFASVGVVIPAAVVSVVRASGDSRPPTPPPGAAPAPTSNAQPQQPPVVPATTMPADVPTSAAPAPPTAFDHEVGPGSVDGKVTALQDRLRELGFDPGPSDGAYGPATERAVWAYQKFIEGVPRADADGVVTPEMWQRMNAPIEIRPRRSGPGTHLEVLLPEQVAVLYVDDTPRLVTHVSSGTGEEWCDVVMVDHEDGTQAEEAICGIAKTPGGVFRFNRRVSGWRNAKLGRLYNPVYFNYGLAVHGANNVPDYPASRGCVRIPMHIAEYFPSLVENGDIVYVFDGVEQPETYGAQLPVFDYPDPNAPTTTTSTTTTTPATTVPPTTSVPTTSVHVDPTTTTIGVEPVPTSSPTVSPGPSP
jgi:hypothetical protein